MHKLAAWLILFAIFTFVNCLDDKPIVEISDGRLRGTVHLTIGENKKYYAFRGIPYAKPPIDLLRFSNPVKNDKWNGTLNATTDSAVCVQSGTNITEIFNVYGSEDCLHLNVYTTNLSNKSNLPVVVWIFGGGFTDGSANYSEYGPDYILEKDVVFVSLNYRLGVFGFLSTEDLAAPGNWGLKDQVLALQWVQENIHQFGGDPSKVTIFGESAGAASVSYLVQAKNKTKGLFRGAIMDSGTTLSPWSLTHVARDVAFQIGEILGIVETNSTKLVEELRKVDAYKLKLAQAAIKDWDTITQNALAGLTVGIVQEPEHPDAIFTSRSYQQLLDGDFNYVPLLIGFNSLEASLIDNRGSLLMELFLSAYNLSPTRLSPYDMTDDLIHTVIASLKIKDKYFGSEPIGEDGAALAKFLTVDQFVRSKRKYIQFTSNYTDVYFYQFSYKGNLSDPFSNSTQAGHAEELNYIFRSYREPSPDDTLTRERMVTLWTNFIKELNPTPTPIDILQNVTWIPNTSTSDTVNHVQCLNINRTIELIENAYQDDWEFYEQLYDKYGNRSWYTTY